MIIRQDQSNRHAIKMLLRAARGQCVGTASVGFSRLGSLPDAIGSQFLLNAMTPTAVAIPVTMMPAMRHFDSGSACCPRGT